MGVPTVRAHIRKRWMRTQASLASPDPRLCTYVAIISRASATVSRLSIWFRREQYYPSRTYRVNVILGNAGFVAVLVLCFSFAIGKLESMWHTGGDLALCRCEIDTYPAASGLLY